MAATRSASAASRIDWTSLTTTLGLKGSTSTSLAAFKKRHDDAKRRLTALQTQPTSVDFGKYRSLLQNQAVVDEMEAKVKGFQVKKVDVERQLKAIEAFEGQAVKQAEETKRVVEGEVRQLEKTLGDIEGARGWGEVTVDEVAAAQPEIDKRTEQLVSKGRWQVPGYKEKFGDLSVL